MSGPAVKAIPVRMGSSSGQAEPRAAPLRAGRPAAQRDITADFNRKVVSLVSHNSQLGKMPPASIRFSVLLPPCMQMQQT
jgi:hypothetical protein